MPNAVTAWSYSRLAQWETCPAQFKYKHLDKLKEEQSAAMARGDKIHKAAAVYVTSPATTRPTELSKFSQLIDELRDMPADIRVVEQQWGFNKNWRPTGWFGKDTWLRVILDAGVVYPDGTADVVDFKTGKKYGTNADQMELFALATFCRYPHLNHVTTRLWYLDSGDEEVAEFEQSDRTEMQQKWEARVTPLFADTVFAPRPNEKCLWCAFARSKNGPCRFG
jgi:hypothetical protein